MRYIQGFKIVNNGKYAKLLPQIGRQPQGIKETDRVVKFTDITNLNICPVLVEL